MFSVTLDASTASTLLIAFLAVLHASFQLGTSVLTLLSGHSLLHRTAVRRVLVLNTSYIVGVFAMTALLLAAATAAFVLWLPLNAISPVWTGLTVLSVAVGLVVATSYYRAGAGTRLWIPRSFAEYLTSRAERTKNPIEAAALGITSVVAELPFARVILAMSSLAMAAQLPIDTYSAIIGIYSFVATLPLIVITLLIAGGHRLSAVQRWREASKQFLQYAAGAGLFAAALYVLMYFVLMKDQP